jgi:hypothetical protein
MGKGDKSLKMRRKERQKAKKSREKKAQGSGRRRG